MAPIGGQPILHDLRRWHVELRCQRRGRLPAKAWRDRDADRFAANETLRRAGFGGQSGERFGEKPEREFWKIRRRELA